MIGGGGEGGGRNVCNTDLSISNFPTKIKIIGY